MFLYVFTGFSLICGGLYLFKPRLFYRNVINLSIFIVKNLLWVKKLKIKYWDEKTQLRYFKKYEIDNVDIHELLYKITDVDKNYTYNYTLKYIVEKHINEINNQGVVSEVNNKLKEIDHVDILNERINKILHCGFYWDDDPETILDLTQDLRHFVLHFDCEKTTLYRFIKYIIESYNLKIDSDDGDTCGLSIIKNDDFFLCQNSFIFIKILIVYNFKFTRY